LQFHKPKGKKGEKEMSYMIGMFTKKRVHVVMYSILTMLWCCPSGQAQPVTGSGQKDYVPLWLSGTSLGDSKIFQSPGGEIGIGTAAPASTLDVNGVVNAAAGFNLGGSAFAFGVLSNQNAFLGFAGNSTMTGGQNTASGALALHSNTTGWVNTATGKGALTSNTSGAGNTATGWQALGANNAGSVNTATGEAALGDNTTGYANTADGVDALASNIGGVGNTATGYAALFSNGGTYNTASGWSALSNNTIGNYNTALGFEAGPDANSTNLSYATAIGAGAVVSQSNALVLGGPLGSSAYVKVGIGTATPSNVLTIAQGAGQAISDGWAVYSSRRWKTNIHTLEGALDKVERLRGVSYDLQANGKHEVGVIAEEVGAVVPEVVTWDKNGRDAQSVDYSRLTALLIEAAKEQQSLIREQQEQIARLTSQVKTIQASLQASGGAGPDVRTAKAQVWTAAAR
jgi:hypothetical protein